MFHLYNKFLLWDNLTYCGKHIKRDLLACPRAEQIESYQIHG